MKSGIVFDVERFATKDGPGIRAVVFMKGCNMRCDWCHNPEGLSFQAELLYDAQRCIGCGACVQVCPQGAHVMNPGTHGIDRSLCTSCLRCAAVCCSGALQVVGKAYTVDSLMRVLMQDALYYRNSGGGVTISGGEPLCQIDFICALLEKLCAAGIHTALETNLSVEWSMIDRALKYTCLLMFDLKHINGQAHCLHTDVLLEPVLANARRVAETEIPVIVRTPVVPGVNDDAETIRRIAGFLKKTFEAQLLYYELLTYHPMGTNKAVKLGMEELSRPLKVPTRERMRALACAAAETGVSVRIDGTCWQEEKP